jgi:protein-L-isoaspartate(D-aspartate) O-methyltransferase
MDVKEKMIREHLAGRDIYDDRVLDAMRAVDRSIFVPPEIRDLAYDDTALPIGQEQTISQPYIVAYMAQALDLQPEEIVLEIGSGCGYNAAVMSRLCSQVYTIEIIEWLVQLANENIKKAAIPNISVKYGDGASGWVEKAPFDKIALTASLPEIPASLKNQLKTGGKLIAPVTNTFQRLVILEKKGENDFIQSDLIPVRFVPMTGATGEPGRWKKGNPKQKESKNEL